MAAFVRKYCEANELEESMIAESKRAVARSACLLVFGLTISIGSAEARPSRVTTGYDGSWHLTFATQAGPCEQAYDFDVNIRNGVITEPNLVKFRGIVASNGMARASVEVQDKVASGSGRLSATSGRGTWSGRSGSEKCAGYWTAKKQR